MALVGLVAAEGRGGLGPRDVVVGHLVVVGVPRTALCVVGWRAEHHVVLVVCVPLIVVYYIHPCVVRLVGCVLRRWQYDVVGIECARDYVLGLCRESHCRCQTEPQHPFA